MLSKLLVPLDHSAFAEQAIGPAAVLARKLGAALDVVLVHEQPALANLRRSSWNEDQLAEENRYVQSISEQLDHNGVNGCSHSVLNGDVVEAICLHAESAGTGMIVMTSHGQTGYSRVHLGSVAYGLVRKSSRPVLVLREAHIAKPSQSSSAIFRKILIPIDGSTNSEAVLAAAAELATRTGAQIVLLRVVEPVPLFGASFDDAAMGLAVHACSSGNIQDTEATAVLCRKAREELADIATRLLNADARRSIDIAVIVGHPVIAAIVDFANASEIDLIAMSTHGRGASRWFLGSVADGVLRTSNFPLLLSRSKPAD